MISKHYSWKVGRFYQPDFVNGSISEPLSWNLYSYVLNNPISYTNPFGLAKQTDISNPSGTGGVISVECYNTPFGEVCIVTGAPVDQPIGIDGDSGTDPFSAEYKNIQDFLDELEATPVVHRPWDLKPNYNDPAVQIMRNIVPEEDMRLSGEYKDCLDEFWECLVGEINPLTPSTSSVGVETSKAAEFYFNAKGYNYALKKGLTYWNKSSVFRGYISKARFAGGPGVVFYSTTLPVWLCLAKELNCLSR